jgi:hypothetical protein
MTSAPERWSRTQISVMLSAPMATAKTTKKKRHGGVNQQEGKLLRASQEEWEKWRIRAKNAGLTLSAWIRAKLNS